MKKGFKLISAFLVSFMIMMSSIMPAFADETDTSTTGDLLDKIQERGELIVGTSPDFPPNEFIDSTKTGQAQYVGSDIELAKYIAKKMGVKLTIKAASFDTVLANLQTEEIDLAITGLAYTPARAQQMEMSIGYNMTEDTGGQAVIIAKKDADKYKKLTDLTGLKVAAQQGSIQQQYTEDQIPDAKLQSISSIDDGVALLKNGTVQAVACSEGTADEYIEKNSELAKLDELFNIDQDYAGNRVGAPLGEKRLMKEVNKKGLYEEWYKAAKKQSSEQFTLTATGFFGTCVQIVQYCWPQLLKGLGITLGLAAITVIFGTIIGGLFALVKLSKNKIVQAIAGVYVELIRGTPLLLQLWLFINIFSYLTNGNMPMIVSVIIALVINSSAYVAEIIRSGIQSVDKGQREAAKSLGMSNVHMMTKIIIPQAIKNILPALGNEFVMMIKETSLASTFYIGELMTVNSVIKSATYKSIEPLVIVGLIYFIVTYSLSKLIKYMEGKLSVSD